MHKDFGAGLFKGVSWGLWAYVPCAVLRRLEDIKVIIRAHAAAKRSKRPDT